MLCAVYKSSKKQETYLYVPGRDDFSKVPKELLATFGTPQFLMIMPLKADRNLARVDINKLRSELKLHGFYLQLPPPTENLLKQHLKTINQENQ
ncbi:YcgL domain-containing protein [Paraglaciecola aquimarina]|uniref:YcgL domain-containing protein L0668_16770 n=1 Tax=Paraglaciecola algarum TaxID=3050085 RepID=A0ABS9DAJ6_9ALTE|nr:YcgL domain-containing protein [Paraglaciecola sp. G1-23]MCF2949774.1 YcgL domain-containing protein [Paraglaciecola sp. G1-23]